MPAPLTIACVGECMIEIACLPDSAHLARTGYGGDTLNTAIYLARLLRDKQSDVHYLTSLGDDPHSRAMVHAWRQEGIVCDGVTCLPGREAGLYMIDLDEQGERHFRHDRRADEPLQKRSERW